MGTYVVRAWMGAEHVLTLHIAWNVGHSTLAGMCLVESMLGLVFDATPMLMAVNSVIIPQHALTVNLAII